MGVRRQLADGALGVSVGRLRRGRGSRPQVLAEAVRSCLAVGYDPPAKSQAVRSGMLGCASNGAMRPSRRARLQPAMATGRIPIGTQESSEARDPGRTQQTVIANRANRSVLSQIVSQPAGK